MCYKCCPKGHYRKYCPNSTGTSQIPEQTPTNSSPSAVTQTVTASYVVPQSSLVTILKELVNAKQTNRKKSIQQVSTKQTPPSL